MATSTEPFGSAKLAGPSGGTTVRLKLDTTSNTLIVVAANPSVRRHIDTSFSVELTDVQLFTDGNRWTAPVLSELQVLSVSGGGFGVADSELGKATAQDGSAVVVRLTASGSRDFHLDRPIVSSFEFSGGYDLPRTISTQSGLEIRSKGGRVVVEAREGVPDVQALRLALSMSFGQPCFNRYVAAGSKLTMVFQQDLRSVQLSDFIFDIASLGYLDAEKMLSGVASAVDSTLAYLNRGGDLDMGASRHLDWFLAARSVTGMLDFRVLCLFSVLEIFDQSPTLNGQSLSRLLGIPLEAAKGLVGVRNEISHGRLTLQQSVLQQSALEETFFGDFVVGDFRRAPAATLMNYLVFATNRLLLRTIGSDLPPARWLPNT